jgi:hypothetical protein
VRPEAIVDAFSAATWRSESPREFMYAVVDGTSLSLTDQAKKKDFGSVGKRSLPTRGLKVIDAIGVDADGTPQGLLDLHVWTRGAKAAASKWTRRRRGCTETQHWVQVIDRVADRARSARVKPWFVIDREGDASVILRAAARAGGYFTVRVSQRKRRCLDDLVRGASVIQALGRRPVCGTHIVHVPKGKSRPPRTAALDVRFSRITLKLHERRVRRADLETFVVWARERRAPRGREPLDWMLFTNRPVASFAAAIISSYCHRWRIEDFHKAWKRGHCHVEDTQLRKRDHVVRWATMLAAVAARVERIKFLARTQPHEPATVALSQIEVDALREAKRTEFSKRTETITDEMPTIATAVRWIAQFGGFVDRPSANPGSVTLGRGLQRLRVYAKGFELGLKVARKRG